MVFTGDQFGDGGKIIRKTLKQHNVLASFFLTGYFYINTAFSSLIRKLKNDGHYLGAHSDKHLLYADWSNRDSLLVTKKAFQIDLRNNYKRMAAFGINKKDAPYFLPPYEWYNSQITTWTKEEGLQLINFTPGTRSAADYTYPQLGERYRSSEEIYRSIFEFESVGYAGLNGFILLIHLGTDCRRKDKFYFRLDQLIDDLSNHGYLFVKIDELLR